MVQRRVDHYQQMRIKFREWMKSESGKNHKWAEYLLFAPDLFHLLCKLSMDRDVPAKEKAKLAAAVAYFASPVDLVPEFLLGPVGFVDDITLAANVLHSVVNNTDPEIVRKHWAGDDDVLEVIKRILSVANKMVGPGLFQKLKNLIH